MKKLEVKKASDACFHVTELKTRPLLKKNKNCCFSNESICTVYKYIMSTLQDAEKEISISYILS